jgi:N6-L-threonylcarbamoyladenine synthase
MSEEKIILGFETSCDETAVSLVKGDEILVNLISSQVEEHKEFGGVVPEIASRAHVEKIRNLLHECLLQGKIQPESIDIIAATDGPGLAGSLVVGYNFAKSFAWSLNKPFYPIDHMVGHLVAPTLINKDLMPPFLSLLVSGGHTQIVLVEEWGKYQLFGQTIDDAAGEAFDKLSRYCGFGFPGGPAIQKLSEKGNPGSVDLPRPKVKSSHDYSFSGLKTAAIYFLKELDRSTKNISKEDFAASYQEAIVDTLISNFTKVMEETGVPTISGGGGVIANSRLREKMEALAEKNKLECYLPSVQLSTDNAAMICAAANKGLISTDTSSDIRLSSVIK